MKNKNQILSLKVSKIILGFFIIGFIIIFSFLSIRRNDTLNSYYYDLGIMNQVVYNTSEGRILEMTNQTYKKNMSRFAIHFDPILAFFGPFYKIHQGPEVLLIGQAIILGLGALAVFLLGTHILKNNLMSLFFAISYLFYFPVERALLFDFHAVVLSTTFLLFAFYFDLVKKYWFYFIFIILSLLTKEHIGLVVLMFGLYQVFVKNKKKVGLMTIFLGFIFFVLTVYLIIPYFRGDTHFASNYFYNIKERLPTIIKNGFSYSKTLILPVFYSIFSPLTFLVALPEWAINIVSTNNNMRSIFFHYNSVIVAVLYYSLILGFKNFNHIFKNRLIRALVLLIFLVLLIRSIYLYNPVPQLVRHPAVYKEISKEKKEALIKWQKILKDDQIKVSTTPKLAPFFTNRQYYYNFLYDSAFKEMGETEEDVLKNDLYKYTNADFVIINRSEIGDLLKGGLRVIFYQTLRDDKRYEMIYSNDRDEDSIEVYRKVF